jgi:hypothetical protein
MRRVTQRKRLAQSHGRAHEKEINPVCSYRSFQSLTTAQTQIPTVAVVTQKIVTR